MFVIQVPYFDLNKIYMSGQNLDWKKVEDYTYIVMYNDKAVLVTQNKDRLIIYDTAEQFYNLWFKYFTLDIPYDNYMFSMKRNCKAIRKSIVRSNGIHIIRQPLFETLVMSSIASTNSVDNYLLLNKIKQVYNKSKTQSFYGLGKSTWYEFPSPDDILNDPDKLNVINNGKKIKFILKLSKDIKDGWINLDDIANCSNRQEVNNLLEDILPQTIIDKICLYSLGFIDTFPETKVIKSILNNKKEGLTIDRFLNTFPNINNVKGLAYQVLMYNDLNPPLNLKEGIPRGLGRQY